MMLPRRSSFTWQEQAFQAACRAYSFALQDVGNDSPEPHSFPNSIEPLLDKKVLQMHMDGIGTTPARDRGGAMLLAAVGNWRFSLHELLGLPGYIRHDGPTWTNWCEDWNNRVVASRLADPQP